MTRSARVTRTGHIRKGSADETSDADGISEARAGCSGRLPPLRWSPAMFGMFGAPLGFDVLVSNESKLDAPHLTSFGPRGSVLRVEPNARAASVDLSNGVLIKCAMKQARLRRHRLPCQRSVQEGVATVMDCSRRRALQLTSPGRARECGREAVTVRGVAAARLGPLAAAVHERPADSHSAANTRSSRWQLRPNSRC